MLMVLGDAQKLFIHIECVHDLIVVIWRKQYISIAVACLLTFGGCHCCCCCSCLSFFLALLLLLQLLLLLLL